jgi:hypothetical protein
METERFIRLSKADEEKLHFSKSKLYKLHSSKKYPDLFRVFDGTVFIDLVELNKLIEIGTKE